MPTPITTLSPAQANFLLKPNATSGLPSIKFTLMLMLSKGVLRMEQAESAGFFRKSTPHLRAAAEPQDAPPEVAALLGVVRAAQERGGTIKAVIAECNKAFGKGGGLFNAKFIVPALTARGLITEKKVLFLRAYRVTDAGEAERSRIRSALYTAADIPKLLKFDPAQAAAVAASLGTLILLSDKAMKQFAPLSDAVRAGGTGDVSGYAGDPSAFGSFDFGSFDLSSFDAGLAGAFESGFGALDAGFSGGGDGGGGDSGGGGD